MSFVDAGVQDLQRQRILNQPLEIQPAPNGRPQALWNPPGRFAVHAIPDVLRMVTFETKQSTKDTK